MKRYICPICEQELTARSYCPECRKIIKKPWVYDGYMPNEYHGDQLRHHDGIHPDHACIEPNKTRVCETPQESRHNQQFTHAQGSQTIYQRYEGNAPSASQSTAPGSQIWRSPASGSSTYSGRTYSSSTSNSRKKNKISGCGCGCLIIVIVIISMINSAISSLEVNLDDWFEEIMAESINVDWGDDADNKEF